MRRCGRILARETAVGVIGGGPVGKTVGVLLSRYGVPTVVVEKARERNRHPKAHAITVRTMEVFRQMGIEEKIMERCPPFDEWRYFRYCTSLSEPHLGVRDHGRTAAYESLIAASPCSPAHVSQPLVEDVLDELVAAEVESSTLNVLKGVTCRGFREHEGGRYVLNLADTESGDEVTGVECNYIVICDGAHSYMREKMGITLDGPGVLQHFVSIHVKSMELGNFLRDRPAMLYFVFNPETLACIVAHNLSEGEFVMQIPFYPPYQSPEDFTSERCHRIIDAIIGETIPYTIRSCKPWAMAAQSTNTYAMEKNTIFLAGDAAHRFPPSGGLGLNTGLQDAHNLAWKIAAVHHGASTASLLESYHHERKHAGQVLLNLAVECFHRGLNIPLSLGLNPSHISNLEGVVSYMPQGVGQRFFDLVLSVGRQQTRLFGGGASQRKVQEVMEKWRDIPLFFSYHDLGVSYDKGKVVPKAVDGVPIYSPGITPRERFPSFPVADGRELTIDVINRLQQEQWAVKGGPRWAWFCTEGAMEPPNEHCIRVNVCSLGPALAVLVRPDGIVDSVYH